MRKLHVQLQQMYDQSHTDEVTDLDMTKQFKEDVCESYRQYSTMSQKIKSEIKQLVDENEQLKKDKEQLEKELFQKTQELAKKGKVLHAH